MKMIECGHDSRFLYLPAQPTNEAELACMWCALLTWAGHAHELKREIRRITVERQDLQHEIIQLRKAIARVHERNVATAAELKKVGFD